VHDEPTTPFSPSARGRGYPANDTIGIGCIGTGGRAQMLVKNLEAIKGARITAVCDVWNQNLAKARPLAGPSAFATKDYHAVLDRKDADVVLIGAPDHQHVALTIAACEAGKDVYVEKPLYQPERRIAAPGQLDRMRPFAQAA
jgi:predicted dehydrogenase